MHIKLMEKFIIVTHNSTFHTDDVFACATLSLAFPENEIEIIRSRDEADFVTADAVVDVGGVYDAEKMRFDHHQKEGAGARENAIPYASFGLVWKAYGEKVAGSELNAKTIDERLVQCIDGADNGVTDMVSSHGVYSYTIIDVISAHRPTWEELQSMDEGFMDAVNVAISILNRIIAHTQSYTNALGILEKAYEVATDKQIIEIGKEYPGWYEVMAGHQEPLYVVYERESGGWGVKAVRIDPVKFETRKAFPQSWAGLRDSELQAVTGVPDAIFCHENRFIVTAATRAGALHLAELAVAA